MSTKLHVVVAGGGVGAAETLLALRAFAGDAVRVTLVAPGDRLAVRPWEPLATMDGRPLPAPSLRALVRECDALLRPGAVQRVLPDVHAVRVGELAAVEYDVLVLAVGARRAPAYPDPVITYGHEREGDDVRAALADAADGHVRSIAFVVPGGVTWPLPLYELALLSARRLRDRGRSHVRLRLLTPEHAPLEALGRAASDDVSAALAAAGVALETALRVDAAERLPDDRVIALPRLHGPRLRGLPEDDDGFLPVDDAGAVPGFGDIFAIGDATTHPIKQGGMACLMADVVAAEIAARAGCDVVLEPAAALPGARLLTGAGELVLGTGAPPDGLWLPAHKIEGRFLSPWLAAAGPPGPRVVTVTPRR